MGNFIVYNLLDGKLKWETVTKNRFYKRHVKEVKVKLDAKGYMIDDNGEVVKKSATADA